MSGAVVLLVDLGASRELLRAVRDLLEGRYRVRESHNRPGTPEGGRAAPSRSELRAEADGGRIAAVAVCTPGPGPALMAFVQEVRRAAPEIPVLAVAECREREALVRLIDSGVDDFCTHPDEEGNLLARLWRLVGDTPPGRVPERLREKVALRNLVGRSAGFLDVLRRIPLIAQVDSAVLITGETGTGKEVVSRAIHHLSPRSARPFVPVNCGALPLNLVENELFGHERAAFTGADQARPGLVAEAEGGTLLLDEVDALPPGAQVKLLRFLQDKEYRRLGSPRARHADVRVIAATNTDVEEAVTDGRLRRDLYYRLNVLPLRLPALEERREDIPLLARHFLAEHSRALKRSCPALPSEAAEALRRRDWPGNVRELSHLMERAVVMAGGRGVVRPADLAAPATAGSSEAEPLSFAEAKRRIVERFERDYLQDVLRAHRGNITQASKAARKNRRAFFELLRKHHIDASRFRGE